jgi:phosphoribosylglycinamide formyltransferase-1
VKIGLICSSGGSSFRATYPVLARRHRFTVLTDRPCGVEEYCRETGIACARIEDPDNASFSSRALERLRAEGGVDAVALFFLRIITAPLVTEIPCFNIHPSLLPAYRGFHALRAARDAGARFFGATLHLATSSVDAGPIVAQVCEPMPADAPAAALATRSYLHKTYLFLLLIELLERRDLVPGGSSVSLSDGLPHSAQANPCLRTPEYQEAMQAIQRAQRLSIFP